MQTKAQTVSRIKLLLLSHVHASNEERTSDEGADAGQGMCKSKGAPDAHTLTRGCECISNTLISVGCGQRGWVDGCRGYLVPLGQCLIREENERRARGGDFDIANIVSLVAINGLNINNPGRWSVRAKDVAKRLTSNGRC
jgi:hypothetical protein